jgi:hypothetical protein
MPTSRQRLHLCHPPPHARTVYLSRRRPLKAVCSGLGALHVKHMRSGQHIIVLCSTRGVFLSLRSSSGSSSAYQRCAASPRPDADDVLSPASLRDDRTATAHRLHRRRCRRQRASLNCRKRIVSDGTSPRSVASVSSFSRAEGMRAPRLSASGRFPDVNPQHRGIPYVRPYAEHSVVAYISESTPAAWSAHASCMRLTFALPRPNGRIG